MTAVLAVLLRAVGIGLAIAAYGALLGVLARGATDANIGAGLLAFALVAVGCGVWGHRDGRRRSTRWLVGVWTATGALVGVGWSVALAFEGGGFDTTVLASDLVAISPFTAALVAGPAIVGGAIGRASPVSPTPR